MPVEEDLTTLSYTRGEDRPLLELTIGELLHRTASRFPDRLAVASRHQSAAHDLGRAQRRGRSRRPRAVVAGHPARRPRGPVVDQLHRVDHDAHGLRPRRRGAGQREPRLPLARTAIHAHALADEGALPVAQGQARRLRRDSGPRAPRAQAGACSTPSTSTRRSGLRCSMPTGRLPDHVAVDDVANIQYTSGTTGLPKGVMLTHHNVVNNGQFLAQGFHYTEQDKIVVPVPLFHCYGCVIGTMSAVNSGAAHHPAQLDLRRARHAASRARRARHQRLRRAGHVCGGVWPARFRQLTTSPACAPA